ncbi:MAG: hypothetical protein KDJ65_17050 [Anaerolineae bacterium]|nr:hypothetical protein [Anaerolineae bacterium]
MGVDTDVKRFEEFAQRMKTLEIKTKRIPLERLRVEFATVFAHRPGIPQRRDWFLNALKYAEQQEIIAFPSVNGRTTWDRTGKPALPKYVTRIQQPLPPKNLWWQSYYWHPKLQWVADLNALPDEQGDFLQKVNQGFFEGWFKQPAPLNRRSVELTGREKRLKQLFKTKLFAEGRLNRELLNITSNVMPLAYEIVGTLPYALVFENKEPYNVARDVLHHMPESPYGLIAYGGGSGFKDSVRDFLRIQNTAHYCSTTTIITQR